MYAHKRSRHTSILPPPCHLHSAALHIYVSLSAPCAAFSARPQEPPSLAAGDLPPPKKHAENTACSCTLPGKCQRTALYMSAQVENSFQIPFEPFPRIEKYPQVAFDMFPQVWKSESGAADSSATHDRHEFAAADFFALHDKHEFCAEIRSLGFWNTNHVCQIHSRRSGKADLTRQIPSAHLWKHKSCAADSFAHVRKRGFSAVDSADGFCAGKFAGTEAPAMVLRR